MDVPNRPSHLRRFALLTALTCAAAFAASLTATAMAPGADAQPQLGVAADYPSRVVLPTGEHLALRWSGDTPRIGRFPGDRSPVSVTTVGSHVYAIPFEAMPYLASTFDRSLFDVTELAGKEGPDATGQVPVSLTFTGASVSVPVCGSPRNRARTQPGTSPADRRQHSVRPCGKTAQRPDRCDEDRHSGGRPEAPHAGRAGGPNRPPRFCPGDLPHAAAVTATCGVVVASHSGSRARRRATVPQRCVLRDDHDQQGAGAG